MNYFRENGNKIIIITLFIVFSMLATKAPAANQIENLIIEARQFALRGDYQNAADLYKKALKLDEKNDIARKELRNLMLELGRINPLEEMSEGEMELIKGKEIEKQ